MVISAITSITSITSVLSMVATPQAEFSQLSDQTKTAYKWRWFLRPVRVSLALLLPTAESRAFAGMVAGLAPAGLEELCAKMPSPAL